jgi:hypothetical protein
MNVARTVWHDAATAQSDVARKQISGGLLGIALLCMLCAAQVTWLVAGGSEAGAMIAAAEGIYIAP